jgi:hypothetical protein
MVLLCMVSCVVMINNGHIGLHCLRNLKRKANEATNNPCGPAAGISGSVCVNYLCPVEAGGGGMTKDEALKLVQEPVAWPRPEDQPIDNGPDCEDGPDEEGFNGPRPWNSFAQPAPVQEPVARIEAKTDTDCAYAYADGWNACVEHHKNIAPATPVPLTDEEMYLNCPNWLSQEQCKVWIQQIEAKLRSKNNG